MNVLLTGASGLLGRYLIKRAPEGVNIWGTWHNSFAISNTEINGPPLISWIRMDLLKPMDIYYPFNKAQPNLVIHCAGVGDVDQCETVTKKDDSWKINVRNLDHVLNAAAELEARFVYLSSNAVFDGENAPYSEEDKRGPVNRYGKMKMLAEDKVRNYAFPWLIVRPILLFGHPWDGGRSNWGLRALQAVERGESLKVVDDTRTQPTYAGFCASAIWSLIEQGKRGFYHVASADRLSLYEFCQKVAEVRGKPGEFTPVPSSHFPNIAPRPKDTTYCLDKLKSVGIAPQSVEDGIEQMIGEPR